jgi:hypothetical protein
MILGIKGNKTMQSMEYRYLHDAQIHALVNTLEQSIHALQFTPSEIRECAMLAAIHYEQRKPPQACISKDSGMSYTECGSIDKEQNTR